MTFGWTWEYVDEYMTLPRLREITDYWEYQPPVHLLIARYLGIKGKTADKPMDANNNNASEFFSALGISPAELMGVSNER